MDYLVKRRMNHALLWRGAGCSRGAQILRSEGVFIYGLVCIRGIFVITFIYRKNGWYDSHQAHIGGFNPDNMPYLGGRARMEPVRHVAEMNLADRSAGLEQPQRAQGTEVQQGAVRSRGQFSGLRFLFGQVVMHYGSTGMLILLPQPLLQ